MFVVLVAHAAIVTIDNAHADNAHANVGGVVVSSLASYAGGRGFKSQIRQP